MGEALQAWRGRPLEPAHLLRAELPLALVEVLLPAATSPRLADLCDAAYLHGAALAPDATASRLRERTQPVARTAWDAGHDGLRWWSNFWGDWHTVVLFTARVGGRLRYGAPVALDVGHPAVLDAATLLGMATS